MAKTALLAGSTGLIGGQLLELLLSDNQYSSIIAISRKPLSITNSKLINLVCELRDLSDHGEQMKADDVFCCLGTIMRTAKTKEAFRKVDFEYPVTLARFSKELGARQFFLVSALGANKSSSIFYNRVKGETEEAIAQVGFESFHIFRPSLLLGPRFEHRSGEDAAKWLYKTLGFLIPQKYKGIESIKVARAMVAIAAKEEKGKFIHESHALQNF